MNKMFVESLLLCILATLMSCGNKNVVVPDSPAPAPFEADARFASLDTLADFMMEEFSAKTVDEYVSRYEQQAVAIKSYGLLNHRKEEKYPLDETVCSDLRELADSLSAGSTMDMVMCGRIWRGVCHYLTARDYLGKSKKPLYQAEMRDWLALEDELGNLYCDLSYLTYWGGTIAHVIASGSYWTLAETRQNDYSKLCNKGPFETDQKWTIASARENFLQELADAKSPDLDDPDMYDPDMYDREGFIALRNQMRERADRVVALLDKWLASRAELCKAEGIPDTHTATLVAQLGTHIMEIIEE